MIHDAQNSTTHPSESSIYTYLYIACALSISLKTQNKWKAKGKYENLVIKNELTNLNSELKSFLGNYFWCYVETHRCFSRRGDPTGATLKFNFIRMIF